MPSCTVCQHERRSEIEGALVRGEPLRDVAGQHDLSKSALSRHGREHLPERIVRAEEAREVARADRLLSEVRHLQGRALSILDQAEEEGDHYAALRAISEARRCLKLLGEVAGELDVAGTTHVRVDHLQALVLDALDGHPDARADVARALYEHDE